MTASVAAKLRQKSTEITISVDQKETVDQAEAALAVFGGVYVKARRLIHVVRDKSEHTSEASGITYPEGFPVILPVKPQRLREMLGCAATWFEARKGKGGKIKLVEVQCPAWVVATLEQRDQWELPWLDGISGTPIFRADGTVCSEPGYDPKSRLIYDPGLASFPAIKERPTLDDARRAYATLADPFFDFPFVADYDEAATIAVILTVLARSAIPGLTPMFACEATIRGSGKGLLFDTCAMINTGTIAPKCPPNTNEDEFRKAMLATAIESPSIMMIDNAEGTVGSPTFAMMLTSGTVKDRLLGVSETRTVPVRFVTLITGNNLHWRSDLGRRVISIQLDPKCENPEDRRGFRHPNLLEHVRRTRPELVAAALTILRAYVVAGKPSHGEPAMGSFYEWDALIRGAIIWASGKDPCAGIQRIREQGDEDRDQLSTLLDAWHDCFGSEPKSTAEVVKQAEERRVMSSELLYPELHAAIGAYCKSGKPETRRLGYVLRQYRGRIAGGLAIQKADGVGHGGAVRYRVTRLSGGDGGDGGDISNPADGQNRGDSLITPTETSPPSQPSPPLEVWEGGVPGDEGSP